jgi:hypothetical protein
MSKRTFGALVVFALVANYVLCGALTQLVQGVVKWSDTGLFVGMAIGVGALSAAILYAFLSFVAKTRSIEPYHPRRIHFIVLGVLLAATAGYSIRTFSAAGAEQIAELDKQRQTTEAARRAIEAERARFAALTPEEREAELQQARDKAAAAKAAQDAEIAKKKRRDAQLQFAALGAAELKKGSKDPDTFELKSAYVSPSGTACYEFRAVNSFGAKLKGEAVLTPNGKILLNERDGNRFVHVWNSDCTKPGGDEIAPYLASVGALNR